MNPIYEMFVTMLTHIAQVRELQDRFRRTLDYSLRRQMEQQEFALDRYLANCREELANMVVLSAQAENLFPEGGAQ